MKKIDFDPCVITQSLVRCASVTPLDEGAIDCIKDHLSELGFQSNILKFTSPSSYEVKNLFVSIVKPLLL